MSSSTAPKGSDPRPVPPKSAKSFPHPSVSDTTDSPSSKPQRANTFQNGAATGATAQEATEQKPDAFESEPAEEEDVEVPRASVDIGIIPIELVSMTDK